jgi:hypothetical protein
VAKGRRAIVRGALAALTLGLLCPTAANAIPASGPHETVDMSSSTTRPSSSAGLGYSARYHSATDPEGDPPALRHLVIELPPGTRIDTSVPARCTANDNEIVLVGEAACPPAARIGSGQATVKQLGLGTATYDTVIYNAPDDMLELVKSGDRVLAVVHTYIHGTTLDGPVPTCLTGGQPPSGCPFDQLTLLSNHLQIAPVSVGRGATRRNYGTTPPSCPPSGRWRASVTLYYGDGSVDTVTPQARCTPLGEPSHRPAIRLAVSPSTSVAGRCTRFRFLATYLDRQGTTRRLAGARIRFAKAVAVTNARGRVGITQCFTHPAAYHPHARKDGFLTGKTTVTVGRTRG